MTFEMNLRNATLRLVPAFMLGVVACLSPAAAQADEIDALVTRPNRWKTVVPFENWRELPDFLTLAWDTQAFENWIKTQPMTDELRQERQDRRDKLREMLREIRKTYPYTTLDDV